MAKGAGRWGVYGVVRGVDYREGFGGGAGGVDGVGDTG